MKEFFSGWILFVFLIVSPIREALEATMTTHMLLLYPLLALSGCLIIWPHRKSRVVAIEYINRGGITGVLIASFTLAFWMIPKWIDHSLVTPWVDLVKCLSLAFLVGSSLTVSWGLLHPILKALLKIEFLTMLLRLGWIYLISPERLCNNYLLNDQVSLGKGFLFLSVLLTAYWILPLFIVQKPSTSYITRDVPPVP